MIFIFIGYILIFFHIRIMGIDILPNFVGYFLIYLGLRELTGRSPRFETAKTLSLILLAATVVINVFSIAGYSFNTAVLTVANLALVVVSLWLMYLINKGLGDIETGENVALNSQKLLKIWKFQVAATVLATVFSIFPTQITAIIALVFAVAAVVVNILFLINLYKAKKALDEAGAA